MEKERRYIRHPAEIPIEVGRPARGRRAPTVYDISYGGLAFRADRCYERGEVITLSIPTVDPPFSARGQVAWCHAANGSFQVGVEFLDESDAFRARMVEQVCHIEDYRRHVQETEGRRLAGDEAAREWISRFGHRFPAADTAGEG